MSPATASPTGKSSPGTRMIVSGVPPASFIRWIERVALLSQYR